MEKSTRGTMTSSIVLLLVILTGMMTSTIGTASAATNSINKVQSGLVASDSLTTGNTAYWEFGGTATLHDYYEDNQGLHLGVKAPSGQWVNYYAASPFINAQLFHAVLTIPYASVSDGVFNPGFYVEGSDYAAIVGCEAFADWSGYYWTVEQTTDAGATWTNLWQSTASSLPQTQDCTVITNGSNLLKVYLGGNLVFSSTSMDLRMPTPLRVFFQADTSSSSQMRYATYLDYYATKSERVRVTNAPLGGTVQIVDSSNNVLASSTVTSDGTATMLVGRYTLPLNAYMKVFDSSGVLVASTSSTLEIYGGDVYTVTISTSKLTVNTQDTTGKALTGYYAALYQSGSLVADGYTPVTFTLNNGQTYTVEVDGYGSCSFDHWLDTGDTKNLRTISITSDNSLTAVLSCDTPLHSTTTTVSPNPASVTTGNSITFTATVRDTNSSPTPPLGSVTWDDGGRGGSFSASTCNLSSASSSTSSCQVTYTPSSPGTVAITASYSGDSTHVASSGTSSVNVFSPLSASAFASPMSGMAPLTVQFSASASGGTPPYSYSWNFGDGASNNQQNSSHTYSNAGTYTATLTITDNTGAKVSSSIQITVNQVNNPPVARDDVTVTNEDTPISINVLANDSDADGDKLTVISVTQPINGTAQISANGSITYSPKRDFNGQDSFTYVISDGRGGTATAKVTVTVNPINDAPVAIDDAAVTNENTPKSINVLANDSDVDGDKLTIASATQGQYGVVSISANGSITYSPNQGFLGQDTFTYTMSDGNGGTATAKVTMTVNAVNHPPVARDDIATTNKNTPISINVLVNDNDPDGDKLTITAVTQPSNGTIQISANSVTYSPRQDFYGQDTFTYTISDGKGGTATARVSVTVNQVAQYYINKKSSGLVASDPRTDPKTRQELEADQRYWRYGGSAVAQNAPVDFFQDSMGLHVGVKAGSNGTYAGFYAVTPNTNASLFHAIITTPTRTIPNNFFQNGLYVQTANGLINYVTCYSVTSTAGTTWHILHTYGNTTYSTKWIVLWSDPSPSQPLTRECTIITNGRNYLKVYLDSIKVYENNTLDLQMPAPFNAYLEPQNSYAGQMLYGIYRDFYIALDENVRVTNVPPEATRVDIVDASNNVLASSAVANGIAVLNTAQYHFPLAVNIKVYDMNNNVIASSSVSIVGGDIYSVDPAQLPNSLSFGQWPDQILAVRREVLSIPKYG